jgi:hypothetical protein
VKLTLSIERITAMLFVAAAIAAYYYSYFERCHKLGLDGYIAYQTNHFDLYMADPTWGYPLYAGLFVAAFVVMIYEVATFVLRLLAKKIWPPSDLSSQPEV